jgi:hypothetical protein
LELPRHTLLVILLLKGRRDVSGQLRHHVLGRPEALLCVAQKLKDVLDARDDLLHPKELTARQLSAEWLLAKTERLELVKPGWPGLPELSVRTLLPGDDLRADLALQERWCVG